MGTWVLVPEASQSKSAQSLQDPRDPGAPCLTLLTPGRDAKAPCPRALPGHPAHQALVPAEMREAPSPPGPASLAPMRPTPSSLWGDWTPQVSMQVPTLLSSVGGGLPEAGTAQLGSLGCLASGCTHKFVLSRGAGLTPSLSHLTGPNPSQGSSCPLPGSSRGGSCKTRDLSLKSEELPQTGLFLEGEGCSA